MRLLQSVLGNPVMSTATGWSLPSKLRLVKLIKQHAKSATTSVKISCCDALNQSLTSSPGHTA